LLSVPSGANLLLSDAIMSSAILAGEDGVPPGGMAGGESSGGNFEFGVDPTLDPELAMVRNRNSGLLLRLTLVQALRISMEEERARQGTAPAGSAAPTLPQVPESVEPSGTGGATVAAGAGAAVAGAAIASVPSMEEDEDDALLAQAIAMSREDQDDVEMVVDDADADEVDEEMSEEEAVARAIEMSMKEEEEQAKGK
jgi:26S proteasome regulatory subunit N10